MMKRKRTQIRPIDPAGFYGPEILIEVSIWGQIFDLIWGYTRNVLALIGLAYVIIWLLL